MQTLRDILGQDEHFACGVELVTARGTMDESKVVRTRAFANELAADPRIDWVSITDNAGGNPQLSPSSLGKPMLYAGKKVVIHLSCKDFNRNGLESAAWHLASEGFHNILALTGDYTVTGYSGAAKPVFDIDSVGVLTLLTEMNQGLGVPLRNGASKSLNKTRFYQGAVAINFKLHEREVIPQYLKLRKKIQCGAEFILGQIGFDAQKSSEMIGYLSLAGTSWT
jgi:methylenetetrahydrofolate reductase (NADH)